MHSEKATKFCEISTLLLTGTALDNSKVDISQNFVAFLEYMNFTPAYQLPYTKSLWVCGDGRPCCAHNT